MKSFEKQILKKGSLQNKKTDEFLSYLFLTLKTKTMENEMEDRPWTKYWIKHYKNDNQFGKMRFKVRKKFSKDLIRIDWEMVDFVEDDEFVKIEPNRLPLFIGSQFGITPRIEK